MLLAAVSLVLLDRLRERRQPALRARRSAARKEIAIRSALGAGRAPRLPAVADRSAGAGDRWAASPALLLAQCTPHRRRGAACRPDPRADEITIDGRVLLFALAASILTGMLAGALPAMRAGTTDLNEALKEGGRNDGAVGLRTRRALIVCEVALSVVLLMGAGGDAAEPVCALRYVDAGFDPRNVLTMAVSLPETRYATTARSTWFLRSALERLRALPGVQAAGAIDDLPVLGGSVQPIVLEGRPELLPRDQPTVEVRKITPGYLRVDEHPAACEGRDVAENDEEVMLVSRAAAKLLWGDDDPIGRRVTLPLQSRTMSEDASSASSATSNRESSRRPPRRRVYEYTRAVPVAEPDVRDAHACATESLSRPAADVIRGHRPRAAGRGGADDGGCAR